MAWCAGEIKFKLASAGPAGARSSVGAYGWSQASCQPGEAWVPPPRPPGMSYQGCHSAWPHTHLQEPPACPGQMLLTLNPGSPHRTCPGVHLRHHTGHTPDWTRPAKPRPQTWQGATPPAPPHTRTQTTHTGSHTDTHNAHTPKGALLGVGGSGSLAGSDLATAVGGLK